MKNASYPKYKPNVQALGPAATKPAVGLAASDRCQVPAPAGTTPPQAERPTPSAGRAGRVPIEGLGQKLSGWTGGWETAGDGGKRKAFRRLLRWGQRTWTLKGKPAESVFPSSAPRDVTQKKVFLIEVWKLLYFPVSSFSTS